MLREIGTGIFPDMIVQAVRQHTIPLSKICDMGIFWQGYTLHHATDSDGRLFSPEFFDMVFFGEIW
jgi:hypothetical protein